MVLRMQLTGTCDKIKGVFLFVLNINLNNTICNESNCVRMVTISQGCDYLVCIIRNIDIKLNHLVKIWARASASTNLKGNVQMPIAWGTLSWDGHERGSDWPESLMGFMSGSMPANSNSTRHEITVWKQRYGRNHAIRCSVLFVPVKFSKAWWWGDLIANDNWLKSKHVQGERCVKIATLQLQ